MHDADRLSLLPPPRSLRRTEGSLALRPTLTVRGLGEDPIYTAVQRELGAGPATGPDASITLLPADDAPASAVAFANDPEGYALCITPSGIRIHASRAAGHLYGVMTLRQLVIGVGDELPCLELGDAPVSRRRGQQYCLAQGHTAYRAEYLHHLVPQLARWKINELYLYLETAFAFPSLPRLGGPGAMTPDDARDLQALCRSYHIELVPMLNLLGHAGELLGAQRYHHLLECKPEDDSRTLHGADLCPSSPATREVVRRQLSDIMAAFPGTLVHVGGDEVGRFGECRECARRLAAVGRLGLYLEHFNAIREQAAAQGRRIGIWGDMLLHYREEWDRDRNQAAIEALRQDAVIYDWHYSGASAETLAFFANRGFETVACSSSHLCYTASPWLGQVENQRLLFRDAQTAAAAGGLTTSWMNHQGLHDELYNLFFASGAAMLWTGAGERKGWVVPGLSQKDFETTYSLQRYGFQDAALPAYWHLLGDATGPVLALLQPLEEANLRKCVLHTDNVLTFWRQYAPMLRGDGLQRYRRALEDAGRLLGGLGEAPLPDPYLYLQAGPLLLHRHLANRFEHCERAYEHYAQAAEAQETDGTRFVEELEAAAAEFDAHRDDFTPLALYLEECAERFGLDRASLLRLQATMDHVRQLAAFLRALKADYRLLPEFAQLEDVFLRAPETHYWIDREHEWGLGPLAFRRYSVQSQPWQTRAINPERE